MLQQITFKIIEIEELINHILKHVEIIIFSCVRGKKN